MLLLEKAEEIDRSIKATIESFQLSNISAVPWQDKESSIGRPNVQVVTKKRVAAIYDDDCTSCSSESSRTCTTWSWYLRSPEVEIGCIVASLLSQLVCTSCVR